MNYEHELAIAETGVDTSTFSRELKGKISRFNQMRNNLGENPDPKKQRDLTLYSAVIADEILDFLQTDWPEHEERVITPEEKAAKIAEYEAIRVKLKASSEKN
jgi:hypothetical protein